MEIPFDRHNMMFLGPDGDTKARRSRCILTDLFKFSQSAVMSAQAMEKAKQLIADGIALLDAIPHDIGLPGHYTSYPRDAAAATSSGPHYGARRIADMEGTSLHEGVAVHDGIAEQEVDLVSPSAPPVSTTKGCRKRVSITEGMPQPHFPRDKMKKRRKCGKCGLFGTGHNAATCDRAQQLLKNPKVKRPRGRPRGTGKSSAEHVKR